MVGNRLALRIDTSVILSNGQVIPRNSIIYAQIALNNNRVQVTVESIKFGTAIYSLELSGYSEDGSPGLPVQNDQNQKIVGDATSSAAASAIDRKISTVTRRTGRLRRPRHFKCGALTQRNICIILRQPKGLSPARACRNKNVINNTFK